MANTTSSIPNWLPDMPSGIDPDSIPFKREVFNNSYTRKDFDKALRAVQLDTIPGHKTWHSNGAAQLLVYLLEEVYKQPIA